MKLIGFSPDRETTEPGVILDGDLFYPTLRGIRALPVPHTALIDSIVGDVRAAYIRVDSSNDPQIVIQVGATKQWASSGTTWTDVTSDPEYLGFTEFGLVTLAYGNAQLAQRTTGSFSLVGAVGEAPIANVCFATDNGFVICADGYMGAGTTFRDQWFSSNIFDYTTWIPSTNPGSANVAADGRLYNPPGDITAGESLGQYGVLYKRNAIYVGQYAGPREKWLWNAVPGAVGCINKGSLIKVEGAHYFLGPDDFYRFDGTRPVPISRDIRRWVFEDKSENRFADIQSAYDPRRKIIVWTWTDNSAKVGVCYSLITGEWGRANYEGKFVTNSHNVQFIEQGTGLISGQWDAGLLMFQSDGKLLYTHDIFGVSTVLTGDFGDEEIMADLTRIRARFKDLPSAAQVQVQYRDIYTDAPATKTAAFKKDRFDETVRASWMRLNFQLSGDWELLNVTLPAPNRKQPIRRPGT